MANIIFTDGSGSIPSPVLVILQKKVAKVYFATKSVGDGTGNSETQTEPYTVVSGDVLGTIATTHETTLDDIFNVNENINANNQDSIVPGQVIQLPKKTSIVTFTKVDEKEMGDEVYIIAETENLMEEAVAFNIKQGVEKILGEKDATLTVQVDGNDNTSIKTTIGAYSQDESIENRADFVDWAIVKVQLAPKDATKKKTWKDGLRDATSKTAKLYIHAEVEEQNASSDESASFVEYAGIKVGESETLNNFLAEEGKYFTLKRKIPIIVVDPGHGYSGSSVNVGAQARKYRYILQDDDGEAKTNDDGSYVTKDAWAGDLPQYVLDDQETWITQALLNKYDSTKLEAFLTYDIAVALKTLLEAEGYTVFNTRSSRALTAVTNSQLDERVKVAKDNNADYFISIHADGSTNFLDSGSHCIYPKDKYGSTDTDAETKEWSKTLASDVFSSYTYVPIESSSPKKDTRGLYVLNENRIKVKRRVLIELGFVSNPKECMDMFDNKDAIALELFNGIKKNVDEKF